MASRVIDQFRRAALVHGPALGDGELLGRFLVRRDEAALAALVERHGPMVWGVCRRMLSHHDAEDAFQATFLVLVRKAATIVPRDLVGNWLYGAAHQTALHARRTATRRTAREVQMKVLPEAEEAPPVGEPDLQFLLDRELSLLPEIYRAVIVLSDLEGRTRKDVALQLGCPEGTVAGRLSRARAMLAKRLTQRGVTLSAGALATILSESAVSAGLPTALVSSTIEQAAGVISPPVASLTEGVLKAMLMSKLKAITAIALVLGFAFTGAAGWVYRNAVAQEAEPVVEVKPEPAPRKGEKLPPEVEAQLKWGEPVNGLRAAMAIRLAPGRPKGDKPELYMAVQNISKEPIRITDADVPKDVNLRMLLTRKDGKILYGLGTRQPAWGDHLLQPREVAFLSMFDTDHKLTTPTPDGDTVGSDHAGQALKDARITFTGELTIEKAPAKAWTGKLITGESGGAAAEIKTEKEAFTAWGKEVGGLQAGLGFKPGEKRTYREGERVKFVVRVRNTGKEAVEFKHIWAYFVENPPSISDADGKRVELPRLSAEGLQRPRNTNIAAGKEVELYEWNFELRPKGEAGKELVSISGMGKFILWCDPIVGPTSGNSEHPNPAMSKLATGKLELDVEAAPKKDKEPEKEAFTAWGKEVGNLQAGMGFKAGEQRVYTHGETVSLVVRIRNVGKEPVKFECFYPYFTENPPTVTNGDGKPFVLEKVTTFGLPVPQKLELAPGKEMVLVEQKYNLKPASLKDGEERNFPSILKGVGKFHLQYGQLARDADSTLGKLATGKLEIEVNAEKKGSK